MCPSDTGSSAGPGLGEGRSFSSRERLGLGPPRCWLWSHLGPREPVWRARVRTRGVLSHPEGGWGPRRGVPGFGLDTGPSGKHFPRTATVCGLQSPSFPQSWGQEDSGCQGLLAGGVRSCRRPRWGGWGTGQSRSGPDGGPSSPPASEAPTKPEPTWRRSGLAQLAGLLGVRAKVCSEDP